MENSIRENLESVRKRVTAAARRASRNPGEVRLLAVTKEVPWQRIRVALECGQLLFGENYVQEAKTKIPQLGPQPCWHFIGRLQSNKIKPAAALFSAIQTVDRLGLAEALNRQLASLGRSLDIFIQVNVGREQQKAGIFPEKTAELLRAVDKLPHLKVVGLMAIPPMTASLEMSRGYFRQLKEMADEFAAKDLLGRHGPVELSMGMSEDFEIAIEEGATLVRVGSAIFGARQPDRSAL